MSTAELNKKKLDLIAWIDKLSDENTIELLDGFKKSKTNSDWWDKLTDSQRAIIQCGVNEIENETNISASEFWNTLKNG